MKGIFSFDSKLMQILGFIADLFIVNLAYLACCIPLFTVGAAQAGLHKAMRVLQDPQDDRSTIKMFFEGFKDGFGRITVATLLVLALLGIAAFSLINTFYFRQEQILVHWAFPLVAVCLLCVYQAMLPLFHSQFSCTVPQLLRNCLLMMIWHPLASLVTGLLVWGPVLVFLWDPSLFVNITPLFLTVYYSAACLVPYLLTRKAFKSLIDEFNKADEPLEVKEDEPTPVGK